MTGRAPRRTALERLCDGIYAILLLAYPRGYREEVGSEMRESFGDQVRAIRVRSGVAGVVRLMARSVADAVVNGVAERMAGAGPAGMPYGVRGPSPMRRMTNMMDSIVMSVRHAFRRLRRSPAFALATVSTVALGVAAFASIFSVVNSVLIRPLPYRDAGDLMWVWRDYTWANFPRGWLGGPDVVELRAHDDVFESVVAVRNAGYNVTSTDGSPPEQVNVMLSSAGLFRTLGVTPMLGRGFVDGEDAPQATSVVVLGHDLWRRRFGSDASILGRDIMLDGEAATVVGVMGPDFHFVKHGSLVDPEGADLYATFQRDLGQMSPNSGSLAALARIRKGTAPAAVTAALETMSRDLDERFFGSKGMRYWGVRLEDDLITETRPALVALLGAGFFLLLVLCANLAALVFGRASERAREISVRKALGASRAGTLFHVSGETLLVSVLGSGIGLVLAYWGTRALVALTPPDLPRRDDIGLDATVVLATFALALLLGFLAGIPAALHALRQPTEAGLRASSPRSGGDARSGITRRVLVAAQVALSLMLLVGAGLVARSFGSLLQANPGFATDDVVTFDVRLNPSTYPEEAQAVAFHESLRDRLSALPVVSAAGATNALPLASSTDQSDLAFPGAPGNTGDNNEDRPLVDYFSVTPGYFEAMRMPLRSGRTFTRADAAASARVAIIDETLARHFFPTTDAVGHTVVIGDTLQIVGVVAHARFYSVQQDDRGQLYRPFAQDARLSMTYAVATGGGARTIGGPILSSVASIDRDVPVTDMRDIEAIVRQSLGQERLSLWLLGGFGLCALLLATLGIYGVVASGVSRRTREVGIRIALGAAPRGVLGLVIREGVAAATIGIVLGLTGALFTSRLLSSLLFGLGPTDPLTYTATGTCLLAVALAAAWIPGRRATRIAPVEALRID